MKVTFDKIHYYSEIAFITLLNVTRLSATQNNIDKVFYDCLFQQCKNGLILALEFLLLFDLHQIKT